MEKAYDFVLNNVVSYQRNLTQEQIDKGENIDMFTISSVIGIAFCKDKSEVLDDILAKFK